MTNILMHTAATHVRRGMKIYLSNFLLYICIRTPHCLQGAWEVMPNIVVPVAEDKGLWRLVWMEEEDQGLRQAFCPLLWVLKSTGLLYGVNIQQKHGGYQGENDEQPTTSGKERKCSFWLFYNIAVFLILLGNFVNSLTTFKSATSFDGN